MTIANTYADNNNVGNPGMTNLMQGHTRVINSGEGATRTLLQKESGALCLFDKADGIVYTLPSTAVIGTYYDFVVSVAITSNAAKVITGAATHYLVGGVIMGSATIAEGGAMFPANGTSHTYISSNGSTTGGLIGTNYRVTRVSSTVWAITGVMNGSGTEVTPFA